MPCLCGRIHIIALSLPNRNVSIIANTIRAVSFLTSAITSTLGTLNVKHYALMKRSVNKCITLTFYRHRPRVLSNIILLDSAPGPSAPRGTRGHHQRVTLIRTKGGRVLTQMTPTTKFTRRGHTHVQSRVRSLARRIFIARSRKVMTLLNNVVTHESRGRVLHASGIPRLFVLNQGSNCVPPRTTRGVITRRPRTRIM